MAKQLLASEPCRLPACFTCDRSFREPGGSIATAELAELLLIENTG